MDSKGGSECSGATSLCAFLFWVSCSPPFLLRAFSESALTAHGALSWGPWLFLCSPSKARTQHFTGQRAEGTSFLSETKSRHTTVELSHTEARNKVRTHYRKVFFGTILIAENCFVFCKLKFLFLSEFWLFKTRRNWPYICNKSQRPRGHTNIWWMEEESYGSRKRKK